jgi:SNF2 family DNA or RNA helicase
MGRSSAPAAALDLLLDLPVEPPAGIAFGASLRFWTEAAKLALELAGRQCFSPGLREELLGENQKVLRGIWEPVLAGTDRQRATTLARAMPPVCRSEAPNPTRLTTKTPRRQETICVQPRSSAVSSASAEELLTSFLNVTIDDFVRRALPEGWMSGRRPRQTQPDALLSWQWLQSLGPAATPISATESDLKRFHERAQGWLESVRPRVSDAAFRLCFRLDEPRATSVQEPRTKNQEPRAMSADSWRLSFLLQATDDLSLFVPSEKVWQARSGVVNFLKRRFENPQERLLGELGKASRVYPSVDESLQTACPTGCVLRTEQAYDFLRQTAPLLEQSGFGVLLPVWWQKPSARVSVRLKVKAPGEAKAGSGFLGVSGIVAYQWQIAIGGETISREEFQKLAGMKVPLVKVRGQWVELKRDEIEKAIAFFERRRAEGEMALSDALRLGLGQEASELGLPVSGIEGEGEIAALLGRLTGTTGIEPVEAPRQFQGELRPYQVRGLSWLGFLSQLGLGACLADDMGLGKTIQLIALLLHERKQAGGPTLVVCPMSVVDNWQREIIRFGPRLKVMVHHGAERLSGAKFERRALKHDVVLTTYALALRDEAALAPVKWNRIVLDEAQNIKSQSARQTQAVKHLPARHRIAMTGTPVENRLSELWSILDFLNPGYLGSARDFRSRFALPIEKYRDPDRTALLRRLTQPYVLRRLKTDKTIIQDLPEKIETRVYCHLTQEQATLYEAVVKEMMQQIERADGIQRRGLVLATLMKLKQICNHPAQFIQDGSALPGRSGKLGRLEEMLDEVLSEGDRALIFTQFAEMGGMLRRHLQQTLSREILFLYGGTPKKQRDTMVQRFQQEHDGPSLFVLSIKAGGLGLNLTAANHVFHFDRWWNPAVENQATDRAFRIGQQKNVQVHKFVCVGTLEERIDQMIEQKKELAELVVGAGEGWITEMNTSQLRDLFALSRAAVEE